MVAGLALVAAGCMVLGSSSRSQQSAAVVSEPAVNSLIASLQPEASAAASPVSRARSLFAGLPLSFEPNQGQGRLDPADRRAQFLARGAQYSLVLGSEGAILNLSSAKSTDSLRMKLAGSNPNASLTAVEALPGRSNYLLGNDPTNWRRNIPQFARIRYENIYPGINLVFYGNQGHLEYDFQVAPGADPAQAELEFDGAQPELNDGALVLHTANGQVTLQAPQVYQEISGQRRAVEGRFVQRAANRVGFALGAYDHSRELVIDPVLAFSTYFGGAGDELANQVAVDASGNIYLAGSTTSTNLPAVGVVQTTLNGTQNIYVAKIIPPLGSSNPVLSYVTYLGGDGVDTPVGIEVDAASNPFVAGTTTSTNFPTTSTTAYQSAPEEDSTGPHHVFVSALNATTGVAASLLYSSYLSGNGDDIASGMAIDSRGYIYVTGTTTSSDTASTNVQFPASTVPQALPYQGTPRAPIQFFVTKVNTNAPKTGSVAYSTYFGGGDFATTDPIAVGGGITVDTNGNIYFTGTTNFIYTGCQGCQTTDFPILNAYQPCLNQAPPATSTPVTCTDNTANADGFVAKLNPNAVQGSQLQWSTYLGGTQTDSSTGVAVDTGAANVYVTGTTNSPDFTPVTTFAGYQRCLNTPVNPAAGTACPTATASTDGYVARVSNPTTSTTTAAMALTYFSYLGGSGNDASNAITVDAANGAIITGWTQSADFPVFPNPNAIQSTLGGAQDAFIARLNTAAVVGQSTIASWANYLGGSGAENGTGVAIDNNQTVYVAGNTNSVNFPVAKPYAGYAGGSDAFVAQLGTAASLQVVGVLTLGTNQQYIYAGNQATFTYTITNNGPDLASQVSFTDDLSSTGVAVTFISAAATAGVCSGGSTTTTIGCNIGSLQSGSTATVTVVLTPTATSDGSATSFNGGNVQVTAQNNITPVRTSVPANMSDFSIQAGPNNFTVAAAGDPATYQVQLFPHPVYVPGISLTCSGLPPGATCGFANASLTLQGTPAATVLTISTTARPIALPTASLIHRSFYAIFFSLPGMALVGFGLGDKRRRRIALVVGLCALFALMILQPACSQKAQQTPVPGTPAGTYPITIAATSGNDTKNATVILTVP